MTLTRRRAALLVAALGGGALVLLALGLFPQEPLRRWAEARLREAVGPGARLGRLSVFPAGLRAEVEGLVLVGAGYQLEADRVRLGLLPAALLGRGVLVRSLELDGVRLLLRPAPPAAAEAPAFEGPLFVGDLRLTRGSLRYEGAEPGTGFALEGIEAQGRLGEGALDVRASGGRVEAARPIPLGPLVARLAVTRSLGLQLESLEAGLPRSRIRAAGELGAVGRFAPDVRFDLALDLTELGEMAGVPAGGAAKGEGRLFHHDEALRAEGRIQGMDLRVGNVPVERLELHGDAGSEEGAGVRLSADLLGGTLRGEGRWAPTSVRGRAQIAGIALERLLRSAGQTDSTLEGALDGLLTLDGDPRGTVAVGLRLDSTGEAGATAFQGHLSAAGPVAWRAMKPDLDWAATLELLGSGSLQAGQLRADGTLRGSEPVAAEGTLLGQVTVGAARPLPVDIGGHFSLRDSRWTGDLTIDGAGGHVVAVAEAVGARFERLEAHGDGFDLGSVSPDAAGKVRGNLDLSGSIDALSGTGALEARDFAWQGASLGTLTADVALDRGGARADLRMPALALRGELESPPGIPFVRGHVALQETPLAPFAPLMGDGKSLDGALVGRAQFSLPLADPLAATAQVEVESFQASSGSWAARTAQPFTLRLAEGSLTVEDLRVLGTGLDLRADGRAGLDSRHVVDVHLRGSAQLGDLPWPAAWTVAGAVGLDARIGGSLRRPTAVGLVELAGVSAASASLPALTISDGRIDLGGDAIVIPGLTASLADGDVTLDARVPLATLVPGQGGGSEEARVRIQWRGLSAAALLSAGTQEELVEATLSGSAEVSGARLELAAIKGHAELEETQGRFGEVEMTLAPASFVLERGRLRTPGLELRSAASRLGVSGLVDVVKREVDLKAQGTLELRALSPLLSEVALSGHADVDLAVRGPLPAPPASGSLAIRDGTLRLRLLPQALTSIEARAVFASGAVSLEKATGLLGGGQVAAAGSARLEGRSVTNVAVRLTGSDLALRYPPGMRSRLAADLTLSGRSGAMKLEGTVKAQRGLYDLDVVFREALFAPAVAEGPSPVLQAIALDLRVETENPVQVRNNLAQLQATGRLTVRGDLEAPSPVGALEIAPGGRVFLQGREFVIRSGRLAYHGSWDPTLSISAENVITGEDARGVSSEYHVSVTVAGSLERPRITLSSQPVLSERQIVSLIATGRTSSDSPALGMAVGGQAAALLVGQLTRGLRGLGLDEVSLRPELVAREGQEATTGARFTFGKRLGSRANLIYSLNLQDPEGRFLVLELGPFRGISTTAQRNDSGDWTLGAGQRFSFGGPARRPPSADERTRVTEVRLEGDQPLEPRVLREMLRTKPGRRSIWSLQDDADRLRSGLVALGYLEAEVAPRFDGEAAVFSVRSGARYVWEVEGLPDPPDLTATIRRALFEEEALDLGGERLLREARARGFVRARVTTREVATDDVRRLVFHVEPGPRYRDVVVAFPGAQALSESRLRKAAGGPGRLLTDPVGAVRSLTELYAGERYLTAEVDSPKVQETSSGLRITVGVREGPRARWAAIRFEGATLPEAELRRRIGLVPGEPASEAAVGRALDRLRELYYESGYPEVRLHSTVERQDQDLVLVFHVAEGDRRTVGPVQIVGLTRTRESLVRRQIDFSQGQPLDPRGLLGLERRLTDLGVFGQATVAFAPLDPSPVTVSVAEGDRFAARYDLRYGNADKASALVDGELRNLLGVGLTLGARYQIGARLNEARGGLSLPAVFGRGSLTLALGSREEDLPQEDPEVPEIHQSRRELQVQVARRLGRRWDMQTGYHLRRTVTTVELLPLPNVTHVSGLDFSLVRDTRDSALDTRRGHFVSLTLEAAPTVLGSDSGFVKGLGQVFLTRELLSGLHWAQGYRVGLAWTVDDKPLQPDEGFRAGGGNSIRGYDEGDIVAPVTRFGPQAVLVFNQELRYRHRTGLGAALFYDAGNVFVRPKDVSFDLRHSVGAGLRWSSPVGLLRLDFGFPIDKRPGEKRFRYFLSLGQAF